jgi:hypothetical protein
VNEINIGELGKIRYDVVGLMKVRYPFNVSHDKIVTAFVYDMIGNKFVDATLNNCLEFEIEPNDHVVFILVCDRQNCRLKIYHINVKSRTVYYGDYEEEQTVNVEVDEVYSVNFDRHRFRSFAVDDDVPDILRFILMYLIPIDLPYNHFDYSDMNEIIDKIKNFSYLN